MTDPDAAARAAERIKQRIPALFGIHMYDGELEEFADIIRTEIRSDLRAVIAEMKQTDPPPGWMQEIFDETETQADELTRLRGENESITADNARLAAALRAMMTTHGSDHQTTRFLERRQRAEPDIAVAALIQARAAMEGGESD